MRIVWILPAMLMFRALAVAADVTVYVVAQGAAATYAAQTIAGSVFRKAGLTVAWAPGKVPATDAPGIRLQVTLAERTPDDRLPGALAVTYPYAGCSRGITVFHDRVRAVARLSDRESSLLAYVLVHEITHVLQRVDRHTGAGVMKASWTPDDRAKIFAKRLAFEPDDLVLIRQGMAAGCSREISARSESGIAARPE